MYKYIKISIIRKKSRKHNATVFDKTTRRVKYTFVRNTIFNDRYTQNLRFNETLRGYAIIIFVKRYCILSCTRNDYLNPVLHRKTSV